MLTKGNINYRRIRIIKVLWKTVSGVINHHIGATITYHDVLHGLQAGIFTGTASLEAKKIQQ